MIRSFIQRVFRPSRPAARGPQILPRARHGIARNALHPCALQVTDGLTAAGYKAFVVGGAVRDLLLGRAPKDFDVATDATPEQVRRVFRRSRIIGRRFQIVHVMCGQETIEVTTFRSGSNADNAEDERPTDAHGRLLSDNIFGSQEDDAARRDFSINALYYDPAREEVWDYHNGVEDCGRKLLRIIGEPETRYREDPVRMLRAARFAAKLGFSIDAATRAPIATLAPLLANVPRARLFDEALKLLMSGHALQSVQTLRREGLHHGILPLLDTILDDTQGRRFIEAALANTDARIAEDRPASPGFLFASLLWPQVSRQWAANQAQGEHTIPALYQAMDSVLETQREQLAIPRRLDGMIKEIWGLQPRFVQRGGQRPYTLLSHPRFRAAYDFLAIRAEAGDADVDAELADWWTHFQDANEVERGQMLVPDTAPKPRRRRRRRKPSNAADSEPADAPTVSS
jgi:poly(A) polymerase